ncbi:unnamed protein product [Didymodactylos carnosus]|uniref:Uncharacterized protein n=1 Tax=Didymodactylos carnosus TaxID=1234261 RepID=A0A815D9L3_9BILA|nr:unnamed protein product [Didymodactylos carnosus]CAF1298573.1 unnamed protein product [Didymodactylos carnosus]CAF3937509.1 unnamed protein product [Didymodactylos carnosus]CAF4118118.1 unnamed protein product [Didymodactylos carnosus]
MSTVRQSMRLAKKRATVNSGDRRQSKLIANQQEKEIEQHRSQRSYSRRRTTVKKEEKKEHVDDETIDKSDSIVIINRAPVLTLWSALVAKKLYGIRWENALTIGRRLAGLLAQSNSHRIK